MLLRPRSTHLFPSSHIPLLLLSTPFAPVRFTYPQLGIEPYSGNRIVERHKLRDGREIDVFRRYGRWRYDTISRLPSILSSDVLDRLTASCGAMIVYLHIGPSRDETVENFSAGLRALDDVARRYRNGTLWVARTTDLLTHVAEHHGLPCS